MFGSLFSWSGLIISLLVVLVMLGTAYFVVRGTARFIQRRRRQRSHAHAHGQPGH